MPRKPSSKGKEEVKKVQRKVISKSSAKVDLSKGPDDSAYENERAVFFWRPHTKNGYLGQWYISPFTIDGIEYHTAEMWMMVQKAKLFGDEGTVAEMLKTKDPKKHKALGRRVRPFDADVWDEHKSRIVEEGSWHKFTAATNAHQLQILLLDTGDKELVEASPLDRVWGVGFGPEKAEANRERWGQNLLGKALMKTRTRIREEQAELAEKKNGTK